MKFLVFNFDGTGNEPEDAQQAVKYKAKKEDDNISNILKLHLMMGGNLFKDGEQYGYSSLEVIDHCFYYQGVGTYGSWVKRRLNQGLAFEDGDVGSILTRAKQDFKQHYTSGDIVLLTGFSRGAALARRFAQIISDTCHRQSEPFIYLCAFDTVASIGLPNLSSLSRPDCEVVFEHGFTLSPLIKHALHIVSLDDKRRAFQPTLMNHEPERITEIWFAGAHSDVGGGYYLDGLSDITLSHAMKWLEHMARTQNLRFIHFFLPTQQQINHACPERLKDQIGMDDLQRNPNPLGKNHQQDRWPIADYFTLDDRKCCVIKEDKICQSIRPTIHFSVAERLRRDDDYRPKSLANVAHTMWYDFTNPPIEHTCCQAHIHHAYVNWEMLEINQAVLRTIEADRYYNFTGIFVGAGEEYRIHVHDKDQWYDSKHVSCNGDGWNCDAEELGWREIPIRLARKLRRIVDADWLTLCATVDSSEKQAKAIGQSGDYLAAISGELQLFANDIKSKYGNNSGSLRVTITRVK